MQSPASRQLFQWTKKSRSNNPRSTVTVTESIYYYLRVLYARAGQPYCVNHDVMISKLSKEEMINIIWKKVSAKTDTVEQKKNASVERPSAPNRPHASAERTFSRCFAESHGYKFDRSTVTILAPVVLWAKRWNTISFSMTCSARALSA